eukprot:8725585-Ditylum_brightwellii.AAC.1
MKTAPTFNQQSNPDVKQAVITFQRPSLRQLELGQFHTYKLRTTPTDMTSPIYELSVPFFGKGTPEEWIKFQHRLQAVLKGQNVTQGPPSYGVAKTLLKGNTLTVFKQAEITHRKQTVPHFKLHQDDAAKLYSQKRLDKPRSTTCRGLCVMAKESPRRNGWPKFWN